MRESPEDAYKHGRSKTTPPTPRKLILDAAAVKTLREKGIVVIDHVLPPASMQRACDEVDEIMDKTNKFEMNAHDDLPTRKDLIYWVSESIGEAQVGVYIYSVCVFICAL